MLTRLFPSREFPTNGTFCAERARALSRYADVRVMTPTPYYPRWLPAGETARRWARVERRTKTAEGIEVTYPRYLSVPKVATWSQGIAMAASVRKEFAREHADWPVDIIDAHYAFPDGYAAVKLAEHIGCAVMVTCHGSDLKAYPPLIFTGDMIRRTLSHADRTISVSTLLRDKSIELGCPPERAVFLTNGVDTDKFPLQDKAQCRRSLDLPAEGPIAVCVGYLIPRKNQSVLIQAVAEIVRRGQAPPLLILVGEGPCRSQLEQEISELGLQQHVRLVGQKPYEEIPLWMGAADWLVLSSLYEGWATVYFEAMASGRPVITSDVPSAKDCVCDDRYGMVVEPNSGQAFADALTTAHARVYDSEIIRAYAQQHSWDNWAKSCLDTINDVLEPADKTDSTP